jgi:hypothetical protein
MGKELTKKQLKRRLKLVEVCYNGLLEELIGDGVFIEGKHYHKDWKDVPSCEGCRKFMYKGQNYWYDDSVDALAHYITNFCIIADLNSDTAEIDMRLEEE